MFALESPPVVRARVISGQPKSKGGPRACGVETVPEVPPENHFVFYIKAHSGLEDANCILKRDDAPTFGDGRNDDPYHRSQSAPPSSDQAITRNCLGELSFSFAEAARALVWITGMVWSGSGVAGSFEHLAAADETPKTPLTICKFCVRTEDPTKQ